MNRRMLDSPINFSIFLVSQHRTKGFFVNISELTASVQPLNITGYLGSLDFMTEEDSDLLTYSSGPIFADQSSLQKGYLWAKPNVYALSLPMRSIASDRKGRVPQS